MRILFVCTGNTCRSPMAEGLFKKIAERKKNIVCESAGICVPVNSKTSTHAIKACMDIGVDISSHCPKTISHVKELESFDFFVVMSITHRELVKMLDIDPRKIYVLGDGIPDPFGQDIDSYIKCRDSIQKGLLNFYKRYCDGK